MLKYNKVLSKLTLNMSQRLGFSNKTIFSVLCEFPTPCFIKMFAVRFVYFDINSCRYQLALLSFDPRYTPWRGKLKSSDLRTVIKGGD